MNKTPFGKTKEGKEVTKYTLTNKKNMEVSVIDLGATVVSLKMDGKDGIRRDIILGYDDPVDYQTHTCYFGAIIGRNANRIGNAKITLDGREFLLEANDNENNLHSGSNGFHALLWDVEAADGQSVTFTLLSKDKEQDFPGNLTAKVTYTLTDDGELVISYEADADQTTLANMTSHCYFNLDGHDSGRIEEQELEIKASSYNPVIDAKAIPTGEILSVENTPMDFRSLKKIGADINETYEQLKFANGYDHNFVLDKKEGEMELAASAKAAASGICMEVYTDLPGLQFYAGNFIGDQTGKDGVSYGDRHGFCLESQYFPNAVNEECFKSPVIRPGEIYRTVTKYRFFTA